MRVLHVFKDAFPPTYGGVEQHIWEITRSAGPELECRVLTTSRSRRRAVTKHDGVTFVRAPEYGRLFSVPITPSWWKELRRIPDTVVHVHAPNPMAELVALTASVRAPVVVSLHGEVVRSRALAEGYALLQQRFLSRADRIVVGSRVLAETSPALARHRARTVVVPYGVDADEWPPDQELVSAIHRAHPGPLVLFLGRLVHYKGVEVLIEAMRRLPATLLVVGDGPRRPALAAAARSAGLGDKVVFVGSVTNDQRSAYYRAASVFVLPAVSRAETFGIAMLEAMSLGTPAICTEVGTGTSWVNRSGQTGLVVPPRQPEALTEAIATLLADDTLRARMGEAAARRAHTEFSKETMLRQLSEVYRSVAP